MTTTTTTKEELLIKLQKQENLTVESIYEDESDCEKTTSESSYYLIDTNIDLDYDSDTDTTMLKDMIDKESDNEDEYDEINYDSDEKAFGQKKLKKNQNNQNHNNNQNT